MAKMTELEKDKLLRENAKSLKSIAQLLDTLVLLTAAKEAYDQGILRRDEYVEILARLTVVSRNLHVV